ncbi:MAG: bifunctional 4-hydroxy-2-oxoglutarate aldolase/2-dehydro-3-deoxy-phosphogluconate aldolase [Oscillospiraceae bacterium]|nr:bifunctional 4-hydroxy-2-oxoglutarate aldolase/2-dehydro-3-deoxy-phosphogluconate aldolase [Oscillospiraceae bacterium]
MDPIRRSITLLGTLPVIRLDHPERDALPLADALLEGGLPLIEITFRAEGAEKAIAQIRKHRPEMLVGAGTVLTPGQVKAAYDAGAHFMVSPGLNRRVVETCLTLGTAVFPGCMTPTEIETAIELGLEAVKFFPAEQAGGIAMIKALSAPYRTIGFVPTGGVTLENLADYLRCPSVIACGGSYMATPKMIEEHNWRAITEMCRRTVDIVKQVKG